MNLSLSMLQELLMDREAWHAAVHGVTKIRTRQSDWTELLHTCHSFFLSDRKSTACYSFGRIWILRKFSSKPASTLFSLWHMFLLRSKNCCCCSVANLCPTLCNPMDCSMTGFPVPHHLQEFAQVHVHCIGDAVQPYHPLTSSSPSAFNLSQHQRLFQWVGCLHQMTKILELQLQHQSFQWIFRVDLP